VNQGIELFAVTHDAAHQVPQKRFPFGRQRRVFEPILHGITGAVVRRVDFVERL